MKLDCKLVKLAKTLYLDTHHDRHVLNFVGDKKKEDAKQEILTYLNNISFQRMEYLKTSKFRMGRPII